MAIGVLVVDDSAFMRKIITDLLESLEDITVLGTARSGSDALAMIPKLNPDLITLDVEMPGLNGIDTLKEIKKQYSMPVLMLSSNTNPGVTIEALEQGARDFIEKPQHIQGNLLEIKQDLEAKIRGCFSERTEVDSGKLLKASSVRRDRQDFSAVVIGASTGGPKALVQLVRSFPASLTVPVFIVQHMPKGFTASLAERMNRESNVPVVEASQDMPIQGGSVYLAPGDYHMTVKGKHIHLNTNEKIHGVRPAVDTLFLSAAQVYRSRLLGVLLTGMGKDGSNGMAKIKEQGGYNLVQDKESSVVFGMPGSAIARGVVDEVLGLEELAQRLNQWMR